MRLIGRLWRGEIGLARTFWVFGFAANVLFKGLSLLLFAPAGTNAAFAIVLLPYLLFLLAYQVLIAVAIWRSAGRYRGYKGWAYLAKAVVVLNILQAVISLAGIG